MTPAHKLIRPYARQMITVKQIHRSMNPVKRAALLIPHGHDDLRRIPLQVDSLHLHRNPLTGTALLHRNEPVSQPRGNKFDHPVESRDLCGTDRQHRKSACAHCQKHRGCSRHCPYLPSVSPGRRPLRSLCLPQHCRHDLLRRRHLIIGSSILFCKHHKPPN